MQNLPQKKPLILDRNIPVAAESKNWEQLVRLTSNGINDVDSKDEFGKTAMYYVAKYGDVDFINFLKMMGGDVNTVADNGATPLMVALENGNIKAALKLLELGANLYCKNGEGKTAEELLQEKFPDKLQNFRDEMKNLVITSNDKCDEQSLLKEANQTLQTKLNEDLKILEPIPRIRLMSFNIRYGSKSDRSKISWAKRCLRIANMIRFVNPDIIALQEVLKEQLSDLSQLLPQYDWVGVGRDDGASSGEYVPILYKRERITNLENSSFWLSENPKVPGSKSWGAQITRLVTWMKVKDQKTGKISWIFNAHFDHESQKSRQKSAELILQTVTQKVPSINQNQQQQQQKIQREAIFLLGDFNMNLTNEGFKTLLKTFTDSKFESHHQFGLDHSFHGFHGAGIETLVDYILFANYPISESAQLATLKPVYQHAIIDDFDGLSEYSSDHSPVVADFLCF